MILTSAAKLFLVEAHDFRKFIVINAAFPQAFSGLVFIKFVSMVVAASEIGA